MVALRVPKIKIKSGGAAELGLRPQTVLATPPPNLSLILATHYLGGSNGERLTGVNLLERLQTHNLGFLKSIY